MPVFGHPHLAYGTEIAVFFSMIGPSSISSTPAAQPDPGREVLHRTRNDRMGGTVPVWGMADKDTARLAVEQSFESVLRKYTQSAPGDSLSYRAPETATAKPEESFSFGDIVDMINPLQHIPVLNNLYRSITGDTITAASRILGGAVFGGPLGFAGSLMNVIVEKETGKDIAGNAVAFVTEGKAPTYVSAQRTEDPGENISSALAIAENQAYRDLPASLLAFADSGAITAKETNVALHNVSSRYNA